MRFVKMHGIGNDYVYVNGFEQAVDEPAILARQVSDRHFGIGSDGLILVLPPSPGVHADVRMRMFNADGSEAEMCGNGIRCVCKLAHDHGLSAARPMRVETGAGVLSLDYEVDPAGKVCQVTVDMGEPILEAARIPVRLDTAAAPGGRVVDVDATAYVGFSLGNDAWVRAAGLDPKMTCVSMGNPHLVLYCRDVAAVPLEQIGPRLETASIFPQRINVHFVQVHTGDELTMRTWERGSGVTLACGTGACAVCAAGVLTGRSSRQVVAHLPGGDLSLRWDEPSGHLFMTGPATEVFTGEWPDRARNSASREGATHVRT